MFDFIDFLRKKWSEYSESTGQKGTVIDELAIKPTGLVLAEVSNLIATHVRINDISKWDTMSDQELNLFGNKFFMPRVEGGRSSGFIRVFFFHKIDIFVNTAFRAVGPNGIQYTPVRYGRIDRNSMQLVDKGSEFYVDIIVQATSEGDLYNREVGEITALSGIDFEYSRVTNPERITGGSIREDNSTYYERLKNSINDRSMMNKRSLFALLREFFPSVVESHVSGPGDRYMTRDYLQAIDLSTASRKAVFTGKIPKDSSVRNYAYYGNFPPEAGTSPAEFAGPLSIISAYSYPVSIDPIDLLSSDPAMHGFPLEQEANSEMYQGLYFDDFQKNMEVSTSDLFNISELGLGFDKIASPDSSWLIGANARGVGDYGPQAEKNGVQLSNIDMISFSEDNINIGPGFEETLAVCKDVHKRVGVRYTGGFTMPIDETDVDGTTLQFSVGGKQADDGRIDAYSGVGFGIHIKSTLDAYVGPYPSPNPANAIVFFSHSQAYAQNQIFATSGDIDASTGIPLASIGSFNALKEQAARLEPGSKYNFEFVFYDDLSLSLIIKKDSPVGTNDDADVFGGMTLSGDVLSAFKTHLQNPDSQLYGTLMKVAISTPMRDNAQSLIIHDIKVVDITSHSSMCLFIMDVAKLEAPYSLRLRGSGSSFVGGVKTEGHRTYIWDTSRPPLAEAGQSPLANGAWFEIGDLSNSNGAKDSISNALTTVIQNPTPYKVQSRFGTSIILMVTTSGGSKASILSKNETDPDTQAVLNVDFVEVKSNPVDVYHSNSKADVHVVTTLNGENFNTVRTALQKTSDDSFFELSADTGIICPFSSVDNVFYLDGDGNEAILAPEQYSVSREDVSSYNSVKEISKISIVGNTYDTIVVEYSSYNNIQQIHDFFNSSEREKVVGDILVKHKRPVFLDISLVFTGNGSSQDITQSVYDFFNENQGDYFKVDDLIRFIYTSGYANNIKEPIGVSYYGINDLLEPVSGEVVDSLTIKTIEFFRVRNVSAERL